MKIQLKAYESITEKIENTADCIRYECGGRRKCGKCKIKVLSGNVGVTSEELHFLTSNELQNNYRLACCHDKNDVDIEFETLTKMNEMKILGADDFLLNPTYPQEGIGIVVDIGTTTIVIIFLDLNENRIIKEVSLENTQKMYGLDVISRINYCNENGNGILTKLIRDMIKNAILDTVSELKTINRMIVCGNTAMEYIFLNMDVSELGVAPFNYSNKEIIKASSATIFDLETGFNIYVIPSFSAFVGGDIVAGVYYLDLDKKDNCLLLDLGTNGEIILVSKGVIYSTSTAAGPAFEGGNMLHGLGSVVGAIDSVKYENGSWNYTTIGNENAIGICGSGYLEIIKEAIENGFIDENGNLEKAIEIRNFNIKQEDIRNFQLAKSAIASGIEVLIESADLTFDSIDKIYVAGGFGRYASKEALIRTGVISNKFRNKIEIVGNSSLKGGIKMVLNSDFIHHLKKITRINKSIGLANNQRFVEKFMENIGFEYEKDN